MWEKLVEVFSSGYFGSILGVVGIIVGVVLYHLSKERAQPVFQQQSHRLLGHKAAEIPSDIQVSFQGRPIPRVSKTVLVIWNAGNKTIDWKDVVEADPLELKLKEDGEILTCAIKKQSRNVIGFAIETTSSGAILKFDFLDPSDGAVVEVVHTCADPSIIISGTVKGVSNGVADWGRVPQAKPKLLAKVDRVATVVGPILGAAMLAYGWLVVAKFDDGGGFQRVLFCMGLLYILFPLVSLWMERRRYPRKLAMPDFG